MHKPGTNPDNVQMSDVLCDFCRAEWTEELPMVEGHQGHTVCGKCLRVAYMATVGEGGVGSPAAPPQGDHAPAGYTCAMCLEQRDDPAWQSPAYPEAVICRRCVKMSAGVLERDPDYGWKRPGRASQA